MIEIFQREIIYLWYFFEIQLRQIFFYWIFGMIIGSAISVFLKNQIHNCVKNLGGKKIGIAGIFIASALGIASPLCMYGTIPITASFSKSGIKDDWLAAFMMSSILLNPQLIIYSAALGNIILLIRIVSCYFCGVIAGLLIRTFTNLKKNPCEKFFNFSGFSDSEKCTNRDTDSNLFFRFAKNFLRNVKATGIYFLLGIFLSAIFQRYVPSQVMTNIFGGNKAWGVLMVATVGVPLYACGGGTIPLLQSWLSSGMNFGSATAFMLTGPATKITNLGALKIVLGAKHFCFYIFFILLFSLISGMLVNLIF